MPMGAYESIQRAGMPQTQNPNAVLVDTPEAEHGLKSRAQQLYQQVMQYHQQYGDGRQRMDYDTARKYHNLRSAFHEAMNQWEHYQSKNRGEENIIDPAQDSLETDAERGKALMPSPPAGQAGSASLPQRLRQAGSGIIPGAPGR